MWTRIGQDRQFLGGQVHGHAIDHDDAAAEIEADRPAFEHRICQSGPAPQHRPDARCQFRHVERLGQVVVRTCVQASTRSDQPSRAVSRSTGTSMFCRRHSFRTEMPSRFGRPMSRMIMS